MDNVLVVEQEGTLRETLRDVLHDAGYHVVLCADSPIALSLLEVAPAPFIVLLEEGRAPRQWNPHTQAFVPIVPMPFDIDGLLTAVADAAGRLGALPSLLPAV